MRLTQTMFGRSALLASLVLAGCAQVPQPYRLAVSCEVQNVQLGASETSLALPGVHRLPGEARVVCSSEAEQDQTVEVGLVSLLSPNIALTTAVRGRFAGLEMQLFEDERQLHPMVVAGAGLPQVLHEVRVPSRSQTQLSIPFFSQIVVPEVLPAGTYAAQSNLSVYTRSKP